MTTEKNTSESPKTTSATTKQRSPNFPVISLKQAVEKVTAIFNKEQLAPAQRLAVLKHMGYSSENGASRMVLSALKKFDLINEDRGSILLTENAKNIVVITDENDERRINSLKNCALSPEIYRKLWEKYQATGLPSDESLRAELILSSGFNAKAVNSFIADFRETLEFAKIKTGDLVSNKGQSSDGNPPKTPLRTEHKPSSQEGIVKEYLIPRKGDKLAVIQIEKPFSKDDYDNIMKWLEFFGNTLIDEVPVTTAVNDTETEEEA